MDQKQMIEILKKEAESNPIASSVFHLFAMRTRTRGVVTISSLKQRMAREGFKHQKSDYIPILELLSNVGVGKLLRDRYGRVKALTEINKTLQSIGSAVCGTSKPLKSFNKKPVFEKVIVKKPEIIKKPLVNKVGLKFVIMINDQPIEIKIPDGMSEEDIAALIVAIKHT